MKTLLVPALFALTAAPAHAATSICLVASYSTTVVTCDGKQVQTYDDGNFTTVSKALKTLTDQGYRIVAATDADRDSYVWTLEKD